MCNKLKLLHERATYCDIGEKARCTLRYAATYLEEKAKATYPRFVAAFAQGASGDISPNNIGVREGQWARGKCTNEFKSAQFNGLLQMKKALEIFEQAAENKVLSPEVDHLLMKVDFTEVAVAKEFTGNIQGAKTSPPSFELAFLRGTAERPGMGVVQRFIVKFFFYIAMGLERFFSLFNSKARHRKIATK